MPRTAKEIQAELHAAEDRVRQLGREFHEAYNREEEERRSTQRAAKVTNACGYSWRSDGTCSYCGSMNVAEAINRLKTPGTSYSGADWKYGWPHKFYIGGGPPNKFYNKHLEDASAEQFAEFSALAEKLLGISFIRDEQGIKWSAPAGWQADGIV